MTALLITKLVLSFLVGGLYIATTIGISERFGSRVGGLVIGLPSTLLVSLVFIAWTQDSSVAVSAVPPIPAAVAASSIFLAVFILLHRYGRWCALVLGIVAWLILTLPLIFFPQTILVSCAIATAFFAIAIFSLNRFPCKKLDKFALTPRQFTGRVVATGSMVATAVALAHFFGPLWGGVFASFPAAFASSVLILERTHGIEFASSVARTMPYGSIGNVLFALTFYLLVPSLGLVAGTLLAYLSALLFGFLLLQLRHTRSR